MKLQTGFIVVLLCLSSCSNPLLGPSPKSDASLSFTDARQNFETQLIRKEAEQQAVLQPPVPNIRLVQYSSRVGPLSAYLTSSSGNAQKKPAIIWVFGGFSNSIDATAWTAAPAGNDQSARAFREAGIITMYPSFRGGNDNPGVKEGLYGEVDDILAAADFLSQQDGVDPNRIYLGGHSTGGTAVLLAAAASDRFRAVFAFGPVEDVAYYGAASLPFDLDNQRERMMRAPIVWLGSIQSPTFVFEGTEQSNLESLKRLSQASQNSNLHFYPIEGEDHFSVLAPLTPLIAAKIQQDSGPSTQISITPTELEEAL